MGNKMEPMHQDESNIMRLEYEEEKGVLDKMRKFFLPFAFFGFFVLSKKLLAGASFTAQQTLFYTAFLTLWCACLPAIFITVSRWLGRIFESSGFFLLGGWLIWIAVLVVAAIVSAFGFLALIAQWQKVSKLKRSLECVS